MPQQTPASPPDQPTLSRLVDAARAARDRAYAPYSKLHVGAALLAPDGTIVSGANVENVSYGLTICAERAAMFRAVFEKRQIIAVAISSTLNEIITPCGACRQVLAEFCGDIPVICEDATRNQSTFRLKALIPHQFRF